MPPEDTRPIEELLDAAGRAVQPAHPGWPALPQRLGQTPQTRRPRWPRWWWLAPLPLGVAAAVVIFLVSFSGQQPTALAEEPPIRVEPLDVDLTVLSVQETEGETLYMPILQQVGRWVSNPGLAEEAGRQIGLATGKSAYAPYPQPARKLTGQALVKDHRLVFNLKEGDNVVRFTNVAATIDPTSVRLVSDRPGTQVKEQDFEYDLAAADALLKRYIDREIVCVGKNGHETSGFLVSYDDNAIVLADGPPSPEKKKVRKTSSLTRGELQAIRLNEVPKDLLVKPTLVWKLRVEKAGKHDMTLSYLCGFIKWEADYVVVVTPGEGNDPDLLDVTGWVSLENTTGATYDRAGLKLIAGDVHRKRDPWAPAPIVVKALDELGSMLYSRTGAASAKDEKKEFVEKSFFEYHLYTLTAPSTVRDRQIKQLNLLSRQQVKAGRRYVYDPYVNNNRLAIELEAKNEKNNHLGMPLPKGRVTFEQRDADGETGVLGRAEIDHTAVKEKLKLKYGFAFDVAGEYTQTDYHQLGPRHWTYTYRVLVRNHKTGDIQVRSVAHLGPNAKITKTSLPFDQKDVQTADFDFLLKANAEQEITYTVDYEY
ncbi:MAG TPA: hypothetical protein VG013_22190 [Gemmataceae bacterium]|jgi:hypothetical protein|nr:hypothetical protein [Gemmataceae bacterium]